MREQRSKGAAGTAAGDGEASLGAAFVIQWVNELASAVRDQRDYLTQLDAAIGDADHGINLDRGLRAAVAKLEGMEQEAPGIILEAVGTALTFTVGGAAGPLYGSGFRDLGRALGSKERFGPEDLLVALRSGLEAIQKLGAAAVGDKTIVDAYGRIAASGLDSGGGRTTLVATVPLREGVPIARPRDRLP